MKHKGLFFILVCFISCAQVEPRYPLNKEKTIFLNSSAERNKKLILEEERLLHQSAAKDTEHKFQRSDAGYLFAFEKKSSTDSKLPKKGDLVRFQYQIQDLNNNILYDKQTLGIVDYAVDQEDLLPALREAMRIMRPDEVVVFLFPSYLCYGYQGDGEKIGINQPLRFTIERLKSP